MFKTIIRRFGRTWPKYTIQDTRILKRVAEARQEKTDENTKEIAKSLLQKAGIVQKERVFGERVIDISRVKPQDVYKLMDTSMEGFFQNRRLTVANFNLLIFSLSEKKDIKSAEKIFRTMKELNVVPNENTYVNMVMVCAKSKDLEKAVDYFEEGVEKFGVDVYLYNALLSAYGRNGTHSQMLQVFRELKSVGLSPNIANYTTLIQGLNTQKQTDLCWQYYNEFTRTTDEMDEVLVTLMIKICARTHDAEKGLKLFNDLRNRSVKYTTCFPYNSLIKVFAKRKDYAEKGIEVFENMLEQKILPDKDSFVCYFLATARAANVKKAFNGLQLMKKYGIKLDRFHFSGLLLTYASGVMKHDNSETIINAYLKDSWSLFQQAYQLVFVDLRILNCLLEVHVNSGRIDMMEGSVLPLYDKLKIRENSWTYRCVILAYAEALLFPKLIRVYDKIKHSPKNIHNNTLNVLLTAFVAVKDKERILEVLELYLDRKMEPRTYMLVNLGNAAYLPDEIHATLMKFKRHGNIVSHKRFKVRSKFIGDNERLPQTFRHDKIPRRAAFYGVSGIYDTKPRVRRGKKDTRSMSIHSQADKLYRN